MVMPAAAVEKTAAPKWPRSALFDTRDLKEAKALLDELAA